MKLACPYHVIAWRLVFAQVATLREIDAYYTLDDMITANEILSERERAEQNEMAKMRSKDGV